MRNTSTPANATAILEMKEFTYQVTAMRRPPWEKGESYDEMLKWQLLLKNEVFTRSKRLFYRGQR